MNMLPPIPPGASNAEVMQILKKASQEKVAASLDIDVGALGPEHDASVRSETTALLKQYLSGNGADGSTGGAQRLHPPSMHSTPLHGKNMESGTVSQILKSGAAQMFETGKVGSVPVLVVQGDLLDMPTPGLAVPRLERQDHDTGIAGAVLRSGRGQGLQAYTEKQRSEGVNLGEVVVGETGAPFDQKVLNVANMGVDLSRAFASAHGATQNLLRAAREQGLSAFSVPSLNHGQKGGLSPRQSAQAMLKALHEAGSGTAKMPEVVVALKDPQVYQAFVQVLRDHSYVGADLNQVGSGRANLDHMQADMRRRNSLF